MFFAVNKGEATSMKKIAILVLCLTLVFTACGLINTQNVQVQEIELPQSVVQEQPQPVTTTVTFTATGDNLIHDGIYLQAAARHGNGGYDFSYCYDNVRDYYSNFDVNWLNQETLVNDLFQASSYPMFSTPGQMGKDLYDVGFRVFSLSNNHSYDKGEQGLTATMDFWNSMPNDTLVHGLFKSEDEYYTNITYQTVNDITIAYLAYTETTNGLSVSANTPYHVIYTSQTDIIQNQIQTARQNADIVVVSNHWGVENSHTFTQYQENLAQQMADWGADVIIGTHPHVVQNAQTLKSADGRDVFVAYSLGNFISTQATTDTMIGAILECTFEKTTDVNGATVSKVIEPKLRPVITHYDANYANVRVYLFEDYTNDLALAHGIRARNSAFSMEYIQNVLSTYISEEYLIV